MSLNIDQKQIAEKKIIGSLGNDDVVHVKTKGGFHMVLAKTGSSPKVLGVGSTKGLAKFMAKRDNPKIHFTELSKAEDDPIAYEAHRTALYQMRDLVQSRIDQILG